MAKAGGQAKLVEVAYDPTTTTLEQFLKLYEDRVSNKTWGNMVRNNPVFKPYLDQPVTNIFSNEENLKSESKNILIDAQNHYGDKKSQKGNIQSKLRVIEANIFGKLEGELQRDPATKDLINSHTRLSVGIEQIGTRGPPATAKIQYTTSKVGELVKNLEEHVKNNPADKPIANAILLLLETGARPSLVTELLSEHYQPNTFTEEAKMLGNKGTDGLLISGETKGVKRTGEEDEVKTKPYNAPLSNRGITILQDQSEYNRIRFGDERLDNFFQIKGKDGKLRAIDIDKDINPLLKKVSPSGIIRKIGEKGGSVETDQKLTAKQFRNLFQNVAVNVNIPKQNTAMLLSRDVSSNTGAMEVYLGQAGEYSDGAINDINKISSRMWALYSLSTPEGKEAFKDGNKVINPTTLIFGNNGKNYIPDTEKFVTFESAKVLPISIQQGGVSVSGFTAPQTGGVTSDAKENVINKILSGETTLDDMDNIRKKRKSRKLSKKSKGMLGAATIIGGGVGSSEAATNFVAELAFDEVFDAATIKALTTLGLPLKVANPVGIATTTMATMTSEIGQQSFEKEDEYAQFLGVDRNTIINLEPEKRKKLDTMFQNYFRDRDIVKPSETVVKGEQLRSLSQNAPIGSDMDGSITTDPTFDRMIMMGQL